MEFWVTWTVAKRLFQSAYHKLDRPIRLIKILKAKNVALLLIWDSRHFVHEMMSESP